MNKNYNKNNQDNSNKSLTDVFKELQDIKNGRQEVKVDYAKKIRDEEIAFNRILVVNKRFNAAGLVLGILFLIVFSTTVRSNYIFASYEEEKVEVGTYEKIDEELDMMGIISNNISSSTKKEIVTREETINFETEYQDNKLLPEGEQHTIQAGHFGSIERTLIRTYEKNEMIDEKLISEVKVADPVNEIIERGTSKFMKKLSIHVGDKVFTTDIVYLYSRPGENEDYAVCTVYKTIDVEFVSEENGFAFVKVDGYEGYINETDLTSEALEPGITEKARLERIALSLKPEMALNKPSGMTRDDFIKIFTNNSQDTEKIFENNAEFFYEIEQAYNINGIFLASIGIHESNWGKSTIAQQKKNLFGYGSYDASAFESSYSFESYRYGIELVAKVLVKYYLNPSGTPIYDGETAVGSYYNGNTVEAVNIRYASDPNWASKVYRTMETLYDKLK